MTNIIEIKNLSKIYKERQKIKVLNKINYKFKKGKIYSLMGPSGSGKSTLLTILPQEQLNLTMKILIIIKIL